MTSSLFATYEDELKDLLKEITDDIAGLRQTLNREHPNYRPPPATGPASRVHKTKALSELQVKLRELILCMEREVSSADFPMTSREATREKMQQYKKQMIGFERDIARLKQDSAAADRSDLLGNADGSTTGPGAGSSGATGGHDGLDDETRKQRVQMAQNTKTLAKGSKALQEAERYTFETEEMSNVALTNVNAQTETIRTIMGRTHEADDELSQAKKILNDMHREMVKNKAILLIIIGVLLLLIFLILYIKFGGSSSTTSTTTTTIVVVTNTPGYTLAPPPPPTTAAPSGAPTTPAPSKVW